MAAILAVLAWTVLGQAGPFWVLMLGAALAVTQPQLSPRRILSLYGADPLPAYAAPELHWWVRVLAERADLPKAPDLYYLASPITNAFAVGRGDDAALAVTDGLLRRLTGRQVTAVLAHEISHIRAGDTTIMALSDVIARLVQALSYVGMWSLVLTLPLTLTGDADPVLLSAILIALPSVVSLLQLALSRSREYDADLDAVALTGDPEGLAGALEALERSEGRLWERAMVARRQVVDPVLLRTHPSTAERARRLRALLPREDLAIGAPFGRNLPEADHLRDRRRPRTLRVRV